MKSLLREIASLDDLIRGETPPASSDLTALILEAARRLGEAQEARFSVGALGEAKGTSLAQSFGPLGHLRLTRREGFPPFSDETIEALEIFSRHIVSLLDQGEAYRQAQVAEESKKRFLASLSHELRTPLNGILGFSQLLEASSLDGDQVLMVKNIDECGQRLLNTVDNILELAEYESEGFSLEADLFAPRAVLEAVSTKYAPLAAHRNLDWSVTVVPGLPSVLRGDPVRLGQAWGHILSNAIKFTPSGSVDVLLAGRPRGERSWELELVVDDTGIGLAPGAFDRGILPFRQHDDTLTRRYGGSGLGLSLCDRIVKAMAGSLTFEHRAGGGTRVRVLVVLEGTEEVL